MNDGAAAARCWSLPDKACSEGLGWGEGQGSGGHKSEEAFAGCLVDTTSLLRVQEVAEGPAATLNLEAQSDRSLPPSQLPITPTRCEFYHLKMTFKGFIRDRALRKFFRSRFLRICMF